MAGQFTLNRTLCAFSGQIGKYGAKLIDTVGKAAGADERVILLGRQAAGQLAALMLTNFGAPEACLAIVSSISAHPSDPADLPSMPNEEVEAEEVEAQVV